MSSRSHLSALIRHAAEMSLYQEVLCSQSRNFSGGDCLNYFESLKDHLESLGPEGSRIGISVPEGSLQALIVLGTMYARRVPVILGSSEFEAHEMMAQKMGLCAVVSDYFNNRIGSILPQVIFSEEKKGFAVINARIAKGLKSYEDCGLVLFTSGSTGKPKAVNLPLAGLIKNFSWVQDYFSLSYEDTAFIGLPISHTFALNTQFIPSYLAGAKSFFANGKEQFSRQYEIILRSKATFITVIGEILRLWDKEKRIRKLEECNSVRHIQLAGGRISEEHLILAKKLFPKALVHKGYGMTETIRTSMISSGDPHFISSTCGYVLDWQKVRVIDNDGCELANGEQGEIQVKSVTCLNSYNQDEYQTQLDEDGYFSTGDIGYLLDSGLLFCVGRMDQVFKMKGKKVSGFELEKVALEIENIEAAKCAAILDQQKGMRPIMFLEANSQEHSKLVESALSFEKKMRSKLSLSKVPRDVVILSKFPRSQNYKIRVGELEKIWKARKGLRSIPDLSSLIRFYKLSPEAGRS